MLRKALNNNQPISETKNIDLNTLLDQTLLINSINYLNRFYKSISIYYDYEIETKNYTQNPIDRVNRNSTKETFVNSKSIISQI
ncbi:hypothetical protein [Spiroplasma endosymbiont of Virgichneumon dumeticola]|uniref:hypothetical protein n=1 Tax=Spiroplasma endosymbiont of Virgichneumon dumeticola TaxID=3139323 RepID=UPI0035C94225